MDELRCRLIRDDGSEWRIRKLMREGAGLRVDAERVDGGGGDGSRGDAGSPPARVARPAADGAPEDRAPENGHLSGEPLHRGDRIEWTTGDGRVVWAMRVPLAAGEGPHAA